MADRLDQTGLSYFWSLIKPMLMKGIGVFYVEGPSTDTVGVWTGTINGLTAYEDGLTVIYVPAVAGVSGGTTLNINNIGAVACYTTGTTALTTHYAEGTPILFTYQNGGWRRADYNSNTTYSTLTAAQITTGTATSARVTTAANINNGVTGAFSAGSTNGTVKLWAKEVTVYTLPIASSDTLGGIKIGTGFTIDANGVLSNDYTYTLPTAGSNTLGGIKVGSGLAIDVNGVLSVDIPIANGGAF